MKDTYQINSLEQIRLLSDPFKLKLVQAFAESAKTAKQVAGELGENVTKLYRHVDALHQAGLLVVEAEKQKRGAVERTFRAVAQRFEADHGLFNAGTGEEGTEAARQMLRVSEAEILDVLGKATEDPSEKAIVLRIRGKASPAKIAALRRALTEWLESVPNVDEASAENAEEFGGLIAFYKID